jgi:hypothetical protein
VVQMKEDDEGIRFHTLPTAGMHRGNRISREKRRRRSVHGGSWAVALVSVLAALVSVGPRAPRGGAGRRQYCRSSGGGRAG